MTERGDSRKAAEIRHGRAIAPRAASVWGWASPAGRLRAARRAHLLARASELRAGLRVLELGCGIGVFTRQWGATGATILAVDISSDLLRAGAVEDAGGRAWRAVMDVEALGLRAGSFDVVLGVSVLHHVDLPRTLAEIGRVLRPGGHIAFSEPNMLNPQVAVQQNSRVLKRLVGGTPHETAFTRWGMTAALRRHGFADTRIVPFDFLHPLIPRRAIPALARLGAAAERTPLLREIAGSLLITATRP
jgi:2-polyprenyl-3-methyl-5-hydroxy-6-metoxy-1,4-benzoquinol methylase